MQPKAILWENQLGGYDRNDWVGITEICKWLLVVNKPAGMLSVPGKAENPDSVYHRLRKKYPEATGPMIVHRLDMATSGLLLVAKTKEVHRHLQAQLANRSIEKRYIALLDGVIAGLEGTTIRKRETTQTAGQTGEISLPLCLNPFNRPLQMVSEEYGKEAVTAYRLISSSKKHTRIAFYPLTGRTHQLRVHRPSERAEHSYSGRRTLWKEGGQTLSACRVHSVPPSDLRRHHPRRKRTGLLSCFNNRTFCQYLLLQLSVKNKNTLIFYEKPIVLSTVSVSHATNIPDKRLPSSQSPPANLPDT